MGPFRLFSLMKDSNCIEDINLKDAASNWKSKDCQAIILLDGLNLARMFYDPNESGGSDVICNGEYKKIAENMRTLIHKFRDVSITLAFFLDGPVDETKLESWIKRREDRLQKYLSTFEDLESKRLSELKGDAFPCLILAVMKEVLKEEKVSIVRSVNDHDKEMAKYVIDNKCLGIFSDDTDFVVFDGIPYVFSAKPMCLDTENMKTRVYRRQKFLEVTELKPEALPIFATLLGNDYIKKEDAKDYSKSKFGTFILKPHLAKKLSALANRIYDESSTTEGRAERLAVEMKQDPTVILKSLLSYDLNVTNVDHTKAAGDSPWDSVVALCHEKFSENFIENQTLSIVTRQLYTQSEKFEDPRNSHVDALGGIRQRIYSLLLHEKPTNGGRGSVTEILAGGANSLKRIPVPLLKIEVDHPGFLKLWKSGEEMDEKRWPLIWWTLRSKSDQADEIVIPFEALCTLQRLFDHHLIIVALALLYLKTVVKAISEKEKKVLMVLATSVPQMDFTQLSENCVEYTTKKAANLATLYMQSYIYVRWAMDVCGLRLKARARDAYSGQLFHYLFQLDDPVQFFEQSGEEARKKYTELQSTLEQAQQLMTSQQPIPANPSVPTENSADPLLPDEITDTVQEEEEPNREEEERRSTESRRERENID